MAITAISNGEAGSSVRTKLNSLISQANSNVIDLSEPSTYPAAATTAIASPVLGDQTGDQQPSIQDILDNCDPATDVVVWPPGFLTQVAGTIYPMGVTLRGPCVGGAREINQNGDYLGGIVSNITKSLFTTGVMTDVTFTFPATIASAATNFATVNTTGFAADDVILIEQNGGAENHFVVATIASVATTTITLKTYYPGVITSASPGDNVTITKLIPVIEDGAGINGRAAMDAGARGGSIIGLAVQGVTQSGSDWDTSIDSKAYVIGYKGGIWGDDTDNIITMADIDIRFKYIAAGCIITGWQNKINVYAQKVPLAFEGSYLNASDVWVDGESVGTVRVGVATASNIYVHEEGTDTYNTKPIQLSNINGCNVQLRQEGSSNPIGQRLELQYGYGSNYTFRLTGMGACTVPPIQVDQCEACHFIGSVERHTGATTVADVQFAVNNEPNNTWHFFGLANGGTDVILEEAY